MKKLFALLLVMAFAMPALAVDDPDVAYVGGTITGVKEGLVGHFDATQENALAFQYMGGKLEIPYDKIESYAYSKEVGVHLGVVAATAVSLIKRRWRQHFLRISFEDAAGKNQVVVFEIPKSMPRVILGILHARAPRGCKQSEGSCGGY